MSKPNDTPEKAQIRDEIKAAGLAGKISPGLVLRVPKERLEPLVVAGKTDHEIAREIGREIGNISNAPICYLRKFYDLPNVKEAREMLESEPVPVMVESEPAPVIVPNLAPAEPEPIVEQQGDDTAYNGVPICEAPEAVELGPIEREHFDPEYTDPGPQELDKNAAELTEEPGEKPKFASLVETIRAICEKFGSPEPEEEEPIVNICLNEPSKIAYGIVAGVARMLREMDGEMVEVEVVVRRV